MRNSPPFNRDRSSALRSAGSCSQLLGAAARANSRSSRQDLRNRFVGQSRGYPLHLECERLPDFSKLHTSGSGSPRPNKVSFEGMGKDGKPVKVSYVRTDLGSQTDACEERSRPELSSTITIGFCSLSMLTGTRAPP